MIYNDGLTEHLQDPVRQIQATVSFYDGDTVIVSASQSDILKEFTIERIGDDSKFFGYGICHRLQVKLIDIDRALNFTTDNTIKVEIGVRTWGKNTEMIYIPLQYFPVFKVDEVRRDEKTNELSITAYDTLNLASKNYVSLLNLGENGYTIAEFATACSDFLGVSIVIPNLDSFYTSYPTGANFEGSETLREALDAVAEATQTVYYLDYENKLTFKRLDKDGAAVLTIDKSNYIELSSQTNRRLVGVCHATELGDNVEAVGTQSGTIQYVRDNPFWDLRDDIGTLVENALAAVENLTINQFSCTWRGNFLLEIGDKIDLVTKDNETVTSYLLDDTLTFNGAMSQTTKWSYSADDETEANPSTLGDVLKQTYAKVDKANKQIDIVASDMQEVSGRMSALQLTTDSINANVTKIEQDNEAALNTVYENLDEITKSVNAKITAEEVAIEVSKQIANGISEVTTTTGTFNEKGLTIGKSGSELSTTISEDGMTINRNEETVLTANNQGVDAYNLHATTYLIVGKYTRFEDYGERTGAFWIGQNGYTASSESLVEGEG